MADETLSEIDFAHPEVWCDKYKVQVLDPDGWREAGYDWNEEITEAEFLVMLGGSTVQLMIGHTYYTEDF